MELSIVKYLVKVQRMERNSSLGWVHGRDLTMRCGRPKRQEKNDVRGKGVKEAKGTILKMTDSKSIVQ